MKSKKVFKLFTSMLVAALLLMSMGITSFAASEPPEYSITLSRVANDNAAHTYEAYQIFKATKITGTDKALSGVDWGTGVYGAALLEALKADETIGAAFDGVASAAGAAQVLDTNKNDADFVKAFANVVNSKLATAAATAEMAAAANSVKLNVTETGMGYYFVKDHDGSQDDENGAYTQYVLKVLGQEAINAKEVVPTLDKKIVEGGEEVSANTASIGDTVTFRINTAVPDTSAYNRYYFIINDTLSEGLTLDQTSVKVYANGSATALTADKYTLTVDGQSFKIVLIDAIDYSEQAIKVEYDAVLNENADITSAGNPNTANLVYSNNPNHEYTGENEPSDQDEDDVTGKTPDITTKTFTTGIKLAKIDGETGAALAGAKFKIEGTAVNAVIINGQIFKQSATGTYYMLKDGTFTTDAATELTADSYDDTNTTYELVNVVNKTTTTGVTFNNTAYTGADGILSFVGLGEGEYTITELAAPEGYNTLSTPIVINIEATLDQTEQTCTWTVTKGNDELAPDNDHLYTFEVENNQGIILPGTGGIGTTIFYIVGGIFILGAAALLLTKIRSKRK